MTTEWTDSAEAPMATGARVAKPSWFARVVSRAMSRDLRAFVVPGEEVARARGLDLETAGLRVAATPRHASVLVLVGELPQGLKRAAAVAYAQMPRPRAILAVDAGDPSPLPVPDVSTPAGQEHLAGGVAALERLFSENAFREEASDFDAEAVRTRTEYTCTMHPEVVRDEPGSCPICGMDLVPRESAGGGHAMHHGTVDHDAREGDDGPRGGMDHGEAGDPAAAHDDREEDGGEGHEAKDHGHVYHGGHDEAGAFNGGDAGHESVEHAGHESLEHATVGEEGGEAAPGAYGGHEGHAGMEHGGQEDEGHDRMEHGEGHGGHPGMDHGEMSGMDHGGISHGGHAGMDHGDMDFMSMIEMTKDLPRSRDGLPMEWVGAPFGPLFPGLPGGLSLSLTLDGDAVAASAATSVVGTRGLEGTDGSAGSFVERMARLDPFAPVAYRVLALRALEDAAGAIPDERTALARVGALECERAASHLGWLAGLGHVLGYSRLARRAARLQLALLRVAANGSGDTGSRVDQAGELSELRTQAGGFVNGVLRTPFLKRRLEGVGAFPERVDASGPVARAQGAPDDARAYEGVYRGLDFEPVVREGGDALSRARVRLEEVERSLELALAAGSVSLPEHASDPGLTGRGEATVETPRGAAGLKISLEDGAVSEFELRTPSTRHLRLVERLADDQEIAAFLVGVVSLDISPWEVVP